MINNHIISGGSEWQCTEHLRLARPLLQEPRELNAPHPNCAMMSAAMVQYLDIQWYLNCATGRLL